MNVSKFVLLENLKLFLITNSRLYKLIMSLWIINKQHQIISLALLKAVKEQGKQFDKITIFMKKNKGKVNDQLEKKEDKEQYYLKLLFVQKVVR